MSYIVVKILFLVPRNFLNKCNSVVTTDGISANWHYKRKKDLVKKPEKNKNRGKAKDKSKSKACTLLLPKHCGYIRKMLFFYSLLGILISSQSIPDTLI